MLRFFLYIPFLRAHVWLTNRLYLKGVCLLPFDGRFVYIMYLPLFVFVHTFFSFVFSIVFVFVFAFEGSFVLDRMNLGFTLWRQIEEWGAPRAQSQFCQFDCFTVTSATPCQSSSRSSYVSSSFLSSVSSSSSLSSQASSSSSSTSRNSSSD